MRKKNRFCARYSSVANLHVCRPFRSHDEFSFSFFVRSYLIYQLERFTRSNDVLLLYNVNISLFVRVGLLSPNKVLTPVYEWICTLQLLRFPVGLLVESSLVSLIVAFDLRSLPTK